MKNEMRVVAALVLVAAIAVATQYELKYDNGQNWGGLYVANQGPDEWMAYDFSPAGVSANEVLTIRAAAAQGPNLKWDGFRVALFTFDNVPGTMLWPTSGTPYYVLPSSSSSWTWVDIPVNYYLPSGVTNFAVAQEQYYYYPNNDPYCLDTSPRNTLHWWEKTPGQPWEHMFWTFTGTLMLRAVVEGTLTGVQPLSFGRVKALFR
jgi:hypothetical protein